MKNNLFIISRHAWPYLGYALGVFILLSLLDLDFFALIALIVLVFFIYVFRNPERQLPFFQTNNSVVVPVDGVVTAIEELQGSEYAYKIDIESSYMNVAVLRMPMNAKVDSFTITRGSRLAKKSKLFLLLNEWGEIILSDNSANKIKILHRLKQGFAPLDIDLVVQQELIQAARYGLMINGVTSVYLQSNFRLNLRVGQEVHAAQTLIGYFS